ncbi:MAG: T9SS type A sorting domain-containing protein [Bacteroidetes bacterium]|nr:T9SS type A sorting domain-containing protein [Bacteroidota bacterium]
MLNKFLSVFIVVLSLGSLPAGQAGLSAQSFTVHLSSSNSNNVSSDIKDTVRILAIMVNFQEDRDGTTSGNGKFGTIYSTDYGNSILDPLPHNQSYFEDHLLFVKNYFRKISKNNLHIEFTVLPDTFSVSQTMRNYSPSPGSDDFTPTGDFAVEAWTLADQLYPGFNFSAFDLFTIFHAGVGRDISLPGSIGNERDLPSVYLGEKSFKEIYGDDFEGIPVSDDSFKITNTMIMPETESRELETISGTFLFEITINGLLCASVGSHLGLPDLFDTETGLSAIGRFGLMDGQGIFAYLGTFPPEPSPWSKIYLGWAEPTIVSLENADVSLVTNLAAGISDTVILKVPINSSEYFLIENRARDANNDGSTVTYKVDGTVITKTFTKDTTGYLSFDVESLAGVIIDVDEFDWAVPGNGILIWHIDENVINEKIAENKVNTDKKRRGVDVEEADGIQDIGETFISIFGDQVIGEGTEEDLWHASNPAKFFQNRFSKDTRPNTLTNSGANSLVTIKDFSEISNRMSFKVEFGDSIIKPLFSINLNSSGEGKGLSVLTNNFNNTNFYVLIDSNLFITDNEAIIREVNSFSKYKITGTIKNNIKHTFGIINSTLKITSIIQDSVIVNTKYVERFITAIPMIFNNIRHLQEELLLGTVDQKVLIYEISNNPNLISLFHIGGLDGTMDVIRIAGYGERLIYLLKNKIENEQKELWTYFDDFGTYTFFDEVPTDLIVTKDKLGEYFTIILTDLNRFYGLRGNEKLFEFSVNLIEGVKSFALTDLKQDGTNYIVLNNGNNIEVYNLTGAMADNFPFADPRGIGFAGTPLTADFEGDSKSEIISITKDGRIFAIDGGTGKIVPGFPISVGSGVPVTPVLYNANGKTNLAVLNDQNVLSAWSISSVEGKLYWSEEFGNPQNTSFIPAAKNTNRINEFFPTSRAYNYPNPVYEGETNIRYYVDEDSKINIKIFDLAGDFVDELNDNAQGGMDNETVWSVSNIQSGVYLARIEAVSSSGKSEFAIIKIAVVK